MQRGHVYAIVDEVDSILIDEARTPLIISGRVADAAKLYYQFASIVRGLERDVDYEVDEEKRIVAPTEDGIEKVEQALGVENLYDERLAEPRPPAPGRAQGQGALQARQGLHRPARRGEDRRRVHRSHPRGPALVGGPAPGGRGQGGREDQGGEPDPRHHHPPELLPPVREARRHDRHGRHRGGRVRRHLRPPGRARSRPTGRWSARTRPTSSTRTEDAKFEAVVDDLVERYETGPAGARRHRLGREVRAAVAPAREAGHPPRGAQRQAARPGGRDRRPGRPAPRRSPSPPTWPAAASTSSSAATPRAWPAARCAAEGLDPETEEGQARYDELLDEVRGRVPRPRATRSASSAASTCSAPSATRAAASTTSCGAARAARAIPGESRFYLSLEDELMRLFATGAMNWVMGKALARRRAHRGEDGHQGHRAGAEHRRAAQRRDPQERPQVRRGDERAAQGDLPAPRPDPRRRRPARRGDGVPRRRRRVDHRPPTASPTTPRSGTSRAWSPRSRTFWPTELTDDELAGVGLAPTSSTSSSLGEATALLRAARGGARRRDRCARSSAR